MPKLRTVQLTAPSAWASYLINGDASSLERDEQRAVDKWINAEDMGSPVDCEDAGFIHYHDAFYHYPKGADCQAYTFLY